MIQKFKDEIKKLTLEQKVQMFEETMVTPTPLKRMEESISLNFPYKRLGVEGDRRIYDLSMRLYEGNSMVLGTTFLDLTGNPEAVLLSFATEGKYPHKTFERLKKNEIGQVVLLKDGLISWFYFSPVSMSAHRGLISPKGGSGADSYPEGSEGIRNLMRSDYLTMVAGECFSLRDEKLTRLPKMTGEALKSGGTDSAEVIEITDEQVVDMLTDTPAFRAVSHMVDLCMQAYKRTPA